VEQNLKQLFQIQRVLQREGYYDYVRISKEIYDFCNGNEKNISDVLIKVENGQPWEYIRGYTEFYGYKFLVNPSVLIPRVETEQIIDIARLENSNRNFRSIIDVGTGSGCIIISLAKVLGKGIGYTATDISKNALKIATKNAVANGVKGDITFVRTNLIDSIPILDNTLIIANLPYIPTGIYYTLDHSVTDYEPKLALDGGKDGLKYYKRLIKTISRVKGKQNLLLLIEIDPSVEEKLNGLLRDREVRIIKDLNNLSRFALISFS
jgi:release factor glutamine methyltransferase